jgi:diguanylate cyclase (GGDEF)-like protein
MVEQGKHAWVVRLLKAVACCALLAVGGLAHAEGTLVGNYRDAHAGDDPAKVLADAWSTPMPQFDPARMQVFRIGDAGTWVILRATPPWTSGGRVLSIHNPGAGKVTLYYGPNESSTTALDDFGPPLHGHGRLIFDIPGTIPASRPLLLKLEPTGQAPGPVTFSIQSWPDYLRDDATWLAFSTACFAVMLTMALMALCFTLILRDMTFGWYAAYLVCYALIQGLKTGYVFHPLEMQLLSGLGDSLGMAATALSVSFAALFMLRFCKVDSYVPLLRMPVLAFAVGMPIIATCQMTGVSLLVDTAHLLLQPLLLLGAVLLLTAGAIAAARGSRHAWFFLAGWTPPLLLTAACGAQLQGMFTDAPWLPDVALAVGAVESIVLSIGLSDRALTIRHDRDKARQLADADPLTGVLNRRAWTESALAMLEEGANRPVALLFLDLDHFKALNDRHGHAAGDRALVAVASALRHELRPNDLLGRFGGEEFVALLRGAERENAVQIATRLCRRVSRLDVHVGNHEMLTVSIGVAVRTPADTVQSLIERADEAMYAAKLGGRNRVVCSGPTGPTLVRSKAAPTA